MTVANGPTTAFELARDSFLDPRPEGANESGKVLARAAQLVIDGIAGQNAARPEEETLGDLAADLASMYMYGTNQGSLTRTPGARHFDHLSVAQLHPAGNMPAIVAALASSLRNNNTIISEVSQLETMFERESVQWMMREIAGYDPSQASGLLVSGGTSANLHALLVDRIGLEQQGTGFKPRQTIMSRLLGWTGLVGRTFKVPQAVLFATEMAHYSLQKSAGMLAPGEIIKLDHVPLVEGGYRMDPRQLEKRIRRAQRRGTPILGVVAVAGETETGMIDDINAIADITERYGVSLHVDGAYGAPFRLSQEGYRLDGIERADSVTIDPHKYLFTNYPGGAILFRDAATHARMAALNSAGNSYMFHTDGHRADALRYTQQAYLGERRIEGSMGGQTAAMVYATIHALGKEGLAALLDHTIDMTHLFARQMADCETLVQAHEIELNTVCFRPNVDLRTLSKAERAALDRRVDETCRLLEEKYGIYLQSTALPAQDPKLRKKGIKEKVFRVVPTNPYTGPDEIQLITNALKTEWEGTNNDGSNSQG